MAELSAEGAALLLAQAMAMDAELEALNPSAEQVRAAAAEKETQAREAGVHPKTGLAGVAGSLLRKWERFLSEHGAAYGFDAEVI